MNQEVLVKFGRPWGYLNSIGYRGCQKTPEKKILHLNEAFAY